MSFPLGFSFFLGWEMVYFSLVALFPSPKGPSGSGMSGLLAELVEYSRHSRVALQAVINSPMPIWQ